MRICLPTIQIDVRAEADVIICGGGCVGITVVALTLNAGIDPTQEEMDRLQAVLRTDQVYLGDVPAG